MFKKKLFCFFLFLSNRRENQEKTQDAIQVEDHILNLSIVPRYASTFNPLGYWEPLTI